MGYSVRREIIHPLANMRSACNHYSSKVANVLDRMVRARDTQARNRMLAYPRKIGSGQDLAMEADLAMAAIGCPLEAVRASGTTEHNAPSQGDQLVAKLTCAARQDNSKVEVYASHRRRKSET